MTSERLTIPDLPAARPRRASTSACTMRVDPWFEQPLGPPARLDRAWRCSLLFAAVWLYFATGLPSAEKLLAYQPPLPTNVRGYDGNPVQTFARERRVELAFDEYPPLVDQRLHLGRGQDLLQPWRARLSRAWSARCSTIRAKIGQRRARARRLDHHPAGRQDICSRTTNIRSAARSARRSSPSGSNRR